MDLLLLLLLLFSWIFSVQRCLWVLSKGCLTATKRTQNSTEHLWVLFNILPETRKWRGRGGRVFYDGVETLTFSVMAVWLRRMKSYILSDGIEKRGTIVVVWSYEQYCEWTEYEVKCRQQKNTREDDKNVFFHALQKMGFTRKRFTVWEVEMFGSLNTPVTKYEEKASLGPCNQTIQHKTVVTVIRFLANRATGRRCFLLGVRMSRWQVVMVNLYAVYSNHNYSVAFCTFFL